eukprot:TRINITY_DN800_c0_g1_i4.p1 TRINITY_DN800_c0_g1~~TRINITY_DN800_c0_g1_i4.p1  ORF type:complete len:536 (+),score=84.90 TRINITY_DN800_c0_g1_i4:94-1701(+)
MVMAIDYMICDIVTTSLRLGIDYIKTLYKEGEKKPIISSLESVPPAGGRAKLTGSHLGEDGATIEVHVGGNKCKIHEHLDSTSLLVEVPPGVGYKIPVEISVDGQKNVFQFKKYKYLEPVVHSVQISEPLTGDHSSIAISGRYFGTDKAAVQVLVGKQAFHVTDLTDLKLTCFVPTSSLAHGEAISVSVGKQTVDAPAPVRNVTTAPQQVPAEAPVTTALQVPAASVTGTPTKKTVVAEATTPPSTRECATPTVAAGSTTTSTPKKTRYCVPPPALNQRFPSRPPPTQFSLPDLSECPDSTCKGSPIFPSWRDFFTSCGGLSESDILAYSETFSRTLQVAYEWYRLSDESLQSAGMEKKGHRLRILRYLKELQDNAKLAEPHENKNIGEWEHFFTSAGISNRFYLEKYCTFMTSQGWAPQDWGQIEANDVKSFHPMHSARILWFVKENLIVVNDFLGEPQVKTSFTSWDDFFTSAGVSQFYSTKYGAVLEADGFEADQWEDLDKNTLELFLPSHQAWISWYIGECNKARKQAGKP